jgi:hypothetical protein
MMIIIIMVCCLMSNADLSFIPGNPVLGLLLPKQVRDRNDN